MRRFVRLHPSLSRLLVLVMVAAALFPALGHAFASGKSPDPVWTEVCTVGGLEVRHVAVSEPGPSGLALLVQHCPYCLVPSFDDSFVGARAPAIVVRGGADAVLPALDSTATSSTPWSAALPRAPPAAL